MSTKKTVGTIPQNGILVADFGSHRLYRFPKDDYPTNWVKLKLIRIGKRDWCKSNWYFAHNGERFSRVADTLHLEKNEPDLLRRVHQLLASR